MPRRRSLATATGAALLLMVGGAWLLQARDVGAQVAPSPPTPPAAAAPPVEPTTLAVRGEATASRPATQLEVWVSVISRNESGEDALADVAERTEQVLAAMEELGVGEGDYQTQRVQFEPIYNREARGAGADWRPQVVAYEASNAILIRSTDVSAAPQFIRTAVESGADEVEIWFSLIAPEEHRAAVIAAAMAAARRDAAALAEAAEARIVRMQSLSLDDAGTARHPAGRFKGGLFGEPAAGPARPVVDLAIQPGDIELNASVTVIYEVLPKDGP